MFPPSANRPDPVGPPGAYQTYRIVAPTSTHWRAAGCQEAGCQSYLGGWITRVALNTELGRKQFYYITKLSGRSYTLDRPSEQVAVFTFEAGQKCFGEHKVRIPKPEIYVVRAGDWRTPGGQRRQFSGNNADLDWLDHYMNNQSKLADMKARG